VPQERLFPYPDKCLRHRVSERFQTGSQPRCEDHGLFHRRLYTFEIAKVRISEHNTKQKTFFLFLLLSESTFGEAKGAKKAESAKLSA
jgi:hypothetical protein